MNSQARKYDAITVLGGAYRNSTGLPYTPQTPVSPDEKTGARTRRAAEAYKAGDTSLIIVGTGPGAIVSGAGEGFDTVQGNFPVGMRPALCDHMAAILIKEGVPARNIRVQPYSGNTEIEAFNTTKMYLISHGVERHGIISNEMHLPRGTLLFQVMTGADVEHTGITGVRTAWDERPTCAAEERKGFDDLVRKYSAVQYGDLAVIEQMLQAGYKGKNWIVPDGMRYLAREEGTPDSLLLEALLK